MKRSTGFTLIELLVVMAIIALLVSILMPMLGQARELARRTKCSGNLRSIAQGLSLYTETYKTSPHLGHRYHEFGDDPDGRYSSLSALFENGAGSNFQNWWLLVRERVAEEQSFACPSDSSYKEPVEETGYGWESRYNVSYGLQPATPAQGDNPGYPGAPGQDSSTFVVGDKPQTHKYGWEKYSANHPDSGTNLANLGGTVVFNNKTGWRKCVADYDKTRKGERVRDNFWRPGRYGSFGSSSFPWYADDTYLYWDEFY